MSGYSRDFSTLKRELIARRELFVDPDFPANNRSILGHSVLPGELPDKKVEWKRPKVSTSREHPYEINTHNITKTRTCNIAFFLNYKN